jgi:hypothetical protein
MPRVRTTARLTLFTLGVVLAGWATACGGSEVTLGPLSITPPEGWYVTDRQDETIKVTNGTIADEHSTEAGTATAVFDIYIRSTQTTSEFRKALKENNVDPKLERIKVGGYTADLVSYATSYFGPSTEVVFIPDWEVRIVYRAAFADDAAFARHRSAFRSALRSLRFRGRPRDRALAAPPRTDARIAPLAP